MKTKLSMLAALSAALFFLTISAERVALARLNGGSTLTTVTQPDIWCQGGSNQGTANTATEVCLDYGGNWLPTTTNKQTSGSSSLQWKSVETKAINAGGAAVAIGGQLGLLVQTTTQIVLTTTPPSAIGNLVYIQYLKSDGTVQGYGVCGATSTTVQSGTIAGGDNDYIWISTGSANPGTQIGTACK